MLAFFPLAPLAGLAPADIANHIGAGLLMLAVGLPLFIPGWFGGGDAKLVAAIALWVGLENLFPYLFSVARCRRHASPARFSTFRSVPLPRFCWAEAWAVRLHQARRRHPLWHRARGRRPARLSAHLLVRRPRRLSAAMRPSDTAAYAFLTDCEVVAGRAELRLRLTAH